MFIGVSRGIRDFKLQFRSVKEENFRGIGEDIKYKSEDKINN